MRCLDGSTDSIDLNLSIPENSEGLGNGLLQSRGCKRFGHGLATEPQQQQEHGLFVRVSEHTLTAHKGMDPLNPTLAKPLWEKTGFKNREGEVEYQSHTANLNIGPSGAADHVFHHCPALLLSVGTEPKSVAILYDLRHLNFFFPFFDHTAQLVGFLDSLTRVEPCPLGSEKVNSLNHWTAREFPGILHF